MKRDCKQLYIILLNLTLIVATLPVNAQGTMRQQQKSLTNTQGSGRLKFAPDLAELLAQDEEDLKQNAAKKTLSQARREKLSKQARNKVGDVLLPSSEVAADEKQSFIVQMNDAASSAAMQAKLAAMGGRILQRSGTMGLVTIEAPRTAIRQLAAEKMVAYISPDRSVMSSGHLTRTTGAEQVRSLISGMTLNGTGIGVAVIDSGIQTNHVALNSTLTQFTYSPPTATSSYTYSWNATGPNSVVKYSRSFLTTTTSTGDDFGHGTHVASLIASQQLYFGGYYTGVAPEANLLNLRVLDNNGAGTASSVIAAIDWCVSNKAAYNIRVINLSLGAVARDSYKNDPLCLAARRAHNAGIVVVAAAGNEGKDVNDNKIYGGIHSPGIDPSVITVGAVNTYGTDARSDDKVATYSSRGPTRGYTTVNGIRVHDNLIKPDLVAPGNRMIGAESKGDPSSRQLNTLVSNHGTLNVFNTINDSYSGGTVMPLGKMTLSGTSMSAPVVAGAVAMMLEANSSLTPSLVKAILMYSAQPLAGFNMFEQGAGELNIDGAVRLAKLVKTTLPTTVGSSLLTATLPTQQSTVGGTTFNWSQGVITNWGFLYGSALMNYWQSVYGSGVMLADATGVSNSTFVKVSGKTSSSVSLKSGAVRIDSSGVMLADGVVVSDGVMLSDGVILADGAVLADGVMLSDGVILSDGYTRTTSTLRGSSSVLGDNTISMRPAQ